jgi:hypothetical protein
VAASATGERDDACDSNGACQLIDGTGSAQAALLSAPVNADAPARRWADTWERAWPAKDIDAIAALYADTVNYRALVHRAPDRGVEGVRDYLRRNFIVEGDVECRFGPPGRPVTGPRSSGGRAGTRVALT